MATTGTFSGASNLESQALEVAREMLQAEDAWVAAGLALDPPENRTRRVTVTPNLIAGTVQVAMTLPVSVADSTDGFQLTATEYIV